MAQQSHFDLVFTVRRRQPELITPAKPTPHEFKLLSDLDDQDGLRFQLPVISFYPNKPSMARKDPAQLIRKALAQTLVSYYPFAGRLREGPNRKLMVDCNEEGVIFIEADADVMLHQFGGSLQPPFPCFEELLYDVPGSEGIINCPLLLIQVTRLKCGGFILGFRLNHTMSDAPGIVQFMDALAEIARGASEPSVPPVWRRELLNARDPPRITCMHREYEQLLDDTTEAMEHQSFFFGPSKLATIRQMVPHHLSQCTTFEVLIAFLWRCRTVALELEPNEDVRLMCVNNARGKLNAPLLPNGYYGNAFVFPAAITTTGKLCGNSLGYALELVKKAKGEATEEYVQSVADLMVIRGRPCFTTVRSWLVSNLSHVQLRDVDFGWGKTIYSGPAKAFPGLSFFISYKNAKGKDGIVVPMLLPPRAMKMFTNEIDNMLNNYNSEDSRITMSCL